MFGDFAGSQGLELVFDQYQFSKERDSGFYACEFWEECLKAENSIGFFLAKAVDFPLVRLAECLCELFSFCLHSYFYNMLFVSLCWMHKLYLLNNKQRKLLDEKAVYKIFCNLKKLTPKTASQKFLLLLSFKEFFEIYESGGYTEFLEVDSQFFQSPFPKVKLFIMEYYYSCVFSVFSRQIICKSISSNVSKKSSKIHQKYNALKNSIFESSCGWALMLNYWNRCPSLLLGFLNRLCVLLYQQKYCCVKQNQIKESLLTFYSKIVESHGAKTKGSQVLEERLWELISNIIDVERYYNSYSKNPLRVKALLLCFYQKDISNKWTNTVKMAVDIIVKTGCIQADK